MKPEKQKAARRLRKQGCSVREIAARLEVSRGSVSRWVRAVPLTSDQQRVLKLRNPAVTGHLAGAETNKRKGEERREKWRQEGRLQAKEADWLHVAGCMLYWGEGDKSRNMAGMSNSDPELLKLFLRFLKECMGVEDANISVRLHVYTDRASVEESEAFWLKILGLPPKSLRKTVVNNVSRASKGKRKRSLKHGTCRLLVTKTEIVQKIYGALQEYGAFQGNDSIF